MSDYTTDLGNPFLEEQELTIRDELERASERMRMKEEDYNLEVLGIGGLEPGDLV